MPFYEWVFLWRCSPRMSVQGSNWIVVVAKDVPTAENMLIAVEVVTTWP